jgi:hypothetical protein
MAASALADAGLTFHRSLTRPVVPPRVHLPCDPYNVYDSDAMNLLSRIETEILQLLIAHGEMYGLEMVAASKLLKPGTIYVTLARMDEKGYVESRTVKSKHESGLPRRLFRATGLGERTLKISQYAGALLKEATA